MRLCATLFVNAYGEIIQNKNQVKGVAKVTSLFEILFAQYLGLTALKLQRDFVLQHPLMIAK